MEKIALYENQSKPETTHWAELTAQILLKYGAECCAKPELVNKFNNDLQSKVKSLPIEEFEKYADCVISFGGDGTILSASRKLINGETPIMGVNVGKLGFLAEYSVTDLEKSLFDLLKGNYRIVDRILLETTIQNRTIYALNDFVIEKKDSSRMITVQAYSNNHYIGVYRADGLIITTPTGSTAYSLSCGGPILAPSAQVFCLTPISPHSLNLRPLVIPDTSEVKLIVYSPFGDISLVADGISEAILKNNDEIIFKRSKAFIKLIKPLNSSYFDLLRNKLLWAANVIDEKLPISKIDN
jgi:NAD+ kinase